MRSRPGARLLVTAALVASAALVGCTAGPRTAPSPEPSSGAPATATATGAGTGDGGRVVEATPTPTPLPSRTAPVPTAAAPVFASSVSPIGPELAERMASSWRPGCPVPLEDLRYVTVSHVDMTGAVRTGELVVHADVAEGVVGVFATLFEARFPVALMRLVDDYGADETTSMEADNTSAFNCRAITGGTAWSEHAYGRAIDLNPVENPYVSGSHVAPAAGRAYLDRAPAPGVVTAGDVVVQAFAAAGWQWGGDWDGPVDYQHFSVTGR